MTSPSALKSFVGWAAYLVAVAAVGAAVWHHAAGCSDGPVPRAGDAGSGVRLLTESGGGGGPDESDTGPTDPQLRAGLVVFANNCAPCHGARGRGDGPMADFMFPKPRDFSRGNFMFTSTSKGMPSDADLLQTVRSGLMPSLMPPFKGALSDEQILLAIRAVRHHAIDVHAALQMKRDPKRTRAKAMAIAHEMLDPGPPVALPPRPAAVDLELGKATFVANCATCHDEDGRARKRLDLVDSLEQPVRPRDLVAGPYKGGSAEAAIATRIVRGLPGSPMPAFTSLTPEELWGTAAYVRSLYAPPPKPADDAPATCPAQH